MPDPQTQALEEREFTTPFAAGASACFWGFITLSSLLLFPVAVLVWVVTLPFDPRKRILHLFTCFWGSLYTWLNPVWEVTIEGRERLRGQPACVMVANHLSLVDILVLFRLFTHFKWVSKVENFRVPLIGWNMSLNRYIPIRRGERASVVQMMRRCRDALAQGSPIMMFPEGTRSPSGRLRNFKTGAFELALAAQVPIQPLVIEGSHEALPKRGFVLQGRHDIRVRVLDPLPYESFRDLSADELCTRVRDQIAAALEASEDPREASGSA